jgi:hypothetical protein
MTQENQGLSTDLVLEDDGSVAGQPAQNGGFDVVPEDTVAAPVEVAAEAAQKAGDEKAESQESGIGYLPPSATTQQDHEVFAGLGKDWEDGDVTIVGMADTRDRTRDAINGLPNVDPTSTEAGREWAGYMQESLNSVPARDQWRSSLDRDGSAWRQQVDSERGPLRMGALSFGNNDSGVLSGEKAVLRIRAQVGLGHVIQVPLWHSGFWVSVKAPSDSAMIELNRRLLDEKVVVGRTTNGLAFANTSSYISQVLLDFVMDYIYDTTLQEKDKNVIRSMIQSHDLPLLEWGLACAVWPRGFQYARPYIDPINSAEKIIKGKLMVSKLVWTDTKAFTSWQVGHMANKVSGSMSTEMVKRYRSEFTIGQARRIDLASNLAITLKVPNVVDYVNAGTRWVAEITQTVDAAFAEPPEDNRRANLIVQHGQATAMRQYTHWVEAIHSGNASIVDSETIENVLNDLSADDDIRTKFFDEVRKYIDDTTIALIGTPAAEHEKADTLPRFPHVLPMNVEHTFFTLLEQKVMRISQRI